MKLLYSFFGICATVLMCASCTTDTTEDLGLGNGYVTLTLTTGSTTRADGNPSAASEKNYNEDKIDRVDLFIFPSAAGTAAGAQPKYVTLTPDANGSTDISFRFEMEEFDKYFPNKASGSCELYVFVNLSEAQIDELKELDDPAEFGSYVVTATDFKKATDNKAAAPDSFVMTSGQQTLNYNASNSTFTISGSTDGKNTIKVTRLAAKIRMAVKMNYVYTDETGAPLTPPAEGATEDEKNAFKNSVKHTIIPSTKNDGTPSMLLFIQDGVVRGQLSGEPLDNRTYYEVKVGDDEDAKYARALERPGSDDREAPEGYDFYNKLPYYSYPNEWENISSEEHNTMLTLQVKWEEHSGYIAEGEQPSGNDDVEPFDTWYSIPVNYNGNKLEANHYYRIKLHVTAVGSQNQHEPMELGDAECEILDWAQSADIDVNIKNMRFLILTNGSEYNMGSDEYIEIPYVTSHETIFRRIDPSYMVKVRFASLDKPSSDITSVSQKTTSNRPYYWGECSMSLTPSESSGETIYTDADNPNNSLFSYSIDNNNVYFSHPFNGMSNTFHIDIKIMHRDMENVKSIVDGTTMTSEDYWTRDIHIIQGSNPVSISYVTRSGAKNEKKNYTISGSYGFWRSYVIINNVSSIETNVIPSDSFTEKITNSLGGVGIPIAVIYSSNYSEVKNNITRDLYEFKVSSIVDKDVTLDLKSSNPQYTERNNIQKELKATLDASSQTVTVGGKIYKIGDPRSPYINNLLESDGQLSNSSDVTTAWNTPTMVSGDRTDNPPFSIGGGTMQYYYPTLEDGSVTNMVSPKFLVSSSFGEVIPFVYLPQDLNGSTLNPEAAYQSDGITRTEARRRCSAYQELWYPAGRWRLPTLAEMELIVGQNLSGAVMKIFLSNTSELLAGSGINDNRDINYWTADGLYHINPDGSVTAASGNKGLVRCVYDSWYWIDKASAYHNAYLEWDTHNFMWGDREIQR